MFTVKTHFNWKRWMRAGALAVLALSMAFVWSGDGVCQGPCTVERGQDPLDVLNQGVLHNIWILQDISGSMTSKFATGGSETKIQASVRILKEIVNEFVDASGKPLVNWAYATFNGCSGGMKVKVNLPPCGTDNKQEILSKIVVETVGGTPIGKSLDMLSSIMQSQVLLPQQKQYILLVTDGQDTCESTSSTGMTGRKIKYDSVNPTLTKNATTSAHYRTVRAGDKGKVALQRVDSLAMDAARGDIITIGMDLDSSDKELTNHIAWEASNDRRSALFADDAIQLKASLRNALSQIGIPNTSVTLGAPIVGSVKELIPLNNPKVTASMVHGDLSSLSDFGEAQRKTLEHQNNVLFTTMVEAPAFKGHLKARLVYEVVQKTVNSQQVDVKVSSFQEVWDAGVELQKRDPDDRTILFSRKGDLTLRPFRVGQVTAAELGVKAGFLSNIDGTGAKTDADAAEIVVQVIRGYRLSKDPATNKIYRADGKLNFSAKEADGVTNTWKLYDSTSPGAAVIGRPQRPPSVDAPQHHTAEYKAFYEGNFNRQTVAYLGTNGGMMHAFRADNGAELWAYIPDDVLGIQGTEIVGSHSTLKDLVALVVAQNNGVQNHNFLMSGAANAEDVVLDNDDDWHTLIAFGRGRGGRFLTALDVTNAGDWDQSYGNTARIPEGDSRLPKLLFNVGNREGVNDLLYDGLGETWSTPVMGDVKVDSGATVNYQAVLLAGSGYGCKGSTEGRYFYVLRLEDGSVLRRLGPIASTVGAPIQDNALVASPTVFNPHTFDRAKLDSRDYVTRSYIGDLQGNVYKLDSSSIDPAKWTFNVIASLGVNQPIGAPVAFLADPNAADRIFFFVGSGGDARVKLAAGQFFKLAGYLDDDADGANTAASLIQDTAGNNFLIDLGDQHRVFIAPVTAHTADGKGTVFFASSRPEFVASSCSTSFSSILYAFQALTGLAAYDLDPNTSGTQSSVDVGAGNKITGLYHRDGHLYVSKSGGFGVASETEVRGSGEFGSQGGAGVLVNVLVNSFRLSPF